MLHEIPPSSTEIQQPGQVKTALLEDLEAAISRQAGAKAAWSFGSNQTSGVCTSRASPDGRLVAWGRSTCTAVITDISHHRELCAITVYGQQQCQHAAEQMRIAEVRWSCDGNLIALLQRPPRPVTHQNAVVSIHAVSSGQQLHAERFESVCNILWAPKGYVLAVFGASEPDCYLLDMRYKSEVGNASDTNDGTTAGQAEIMRRAVHKAKLVKVQETGWSVDEAWSPTGLHLALVLSEHLDNRFYYKNVICDAFTGRTLTVQTSGENSRGNAIDSTNWVPIWNASGEQCFLPLACHLLLSNVAASDSY
ncbi:hypothetical protein WJX84_011370 [Apatococcus fuscideae]|uniref:Uncharacterized protein n=1 Tax=Apatococcus fuscideae TaxID=2026836 RepID=A0AAW1T9T3_9CHLO